MSGAAKLKFGFIPFPLAIVDEDADLSLGEYRLLGYLLRHRFRVKAERFRMTQDELLRGVTKRDGTRQDKGCGITSGRDLKKAREALQGRGWLLVEERPEGMFYEMRLVEDDEDEDTPSASAKCTGDVASHESAKCPDPECKMSRSRVQNALDDNKELRRLKKEQEKDSIPAVAGERISQNEKKSLSDKEIIIRAFAFYCELMKRDPSRYTLTEHRLKKALLRLRERTAAVGRANALIEIKTAIQNVAANDYLVSNGYIDWVDQIFKSAEEFEKRVNWTPSASGGQRNAQTSATFATNSGGIGEWLQRTVGGRPEAVSGGELSPRVRPVLGEGGGRPGVP